MKKLFGHVLDFLTLAVVIFTLVLLVKTYWLQPFQVEGHSMEPSLEDGQLLMMNRQAAIDRFDIVVFPDPRGSGESYVKRVIGLPGDHLAVQDDVLYLNGQALEEPYLEPLKGQSPHPFTQDFSLEASLGLEAIPPGYAFVMGDNRPQSGDSRQFGLVALASIEGESRFIYYPFQDFGQADGYDLVQTDDTMYIE